jgi:polyphosphate glucokinase
MAEAAIGVDIGRSGIKAARVDLAFGTVTGRRRVPMPRPPTADAVAAEIKSLIGRFDVGGPIGCALPEVVARGIVRTAANVDESWLGIDASSLIADATGRPCAVLNDTDAAGVGELHFGAARGRDGVVLLVTIGTGVGTALLHDGVLVPNTELGRLEVRDHLAATWVSDRTRTKRDVSWKKWARRVDRYLGALHEALSPDLIVIGGSVVKYADHFARRLDPGCEVRIATLGNLAGIAGAALAGHGRVPVTGDDPG